MAIVASATWSIQGRDGSHAISAQIMSGFLAPVFTISVDGMQVSEIKNRQMGALWKSQHSLRIGPHAGLLKISRKGLGGAQFDLIVDGKPAAPNQHTVIETPAAVAAPAPQIIYTQAPPQPVPAAASTPVMPVLPPKCPNCGTPISMDSVQWTGPMSARCPACNNGVEVEWRKLGG